MVLILGDSPDKLMNTSSGVFECLRLAILVWRISDNESVLTDVNTNVSHNINEFKQICNIETS